MRRLFLCASLYSLSGSRPQITGDVRQIFCVEYGGGNQVGCGDEMLVSTVLVSGDGVCLSRC